MCLDNLESFRMILKVAICNAIYAYYPESFATKILLCGRFLLFLTLVLSLRLKQQYLSALPYFKLTLLANGVDVCTMSVM